jgi:regulator of protease activity HflC (stomatin/prohibitin superfamily)
MSLTDDRADGLPGAPLSRAVELLRRLAWLYGVYVVFIALMLGLGAVPGGGANRFKGLAGEVFISGLGEVALAASLSALIPLTAAGVLAFARLDHRRREAAFTAGEVRPALPGVLAILGRWEPGVIARQGQAMVLPVGAFLIGLLSWLLWPSVQAPPPVVANANLVAAIVIGLSFPSLIAERMMAGFPAAQMPEAPGLSRLLLLTTVMLALTGVAEIGRALGIGWSGWGQRALATVVVLIALELALRAIGRLFLPPPTPETAKAATDSLIAGLLTGGVGAPVVLIRNHLGLDFARSWALSYLSAAAVPALVLTALLCWLLTGAKLLESDQRGVYERLGAPVAVLGPGFHVLLPWPLGRLRPVEYGTVHTLAVGAEQGPDAFEKTEKAERIGAEDTPPAAMNRLWDTAHATEAEYLVASQTAGQQGFQAVNAEILVLYRTGLTDAAARQAVYGSADQATVVGQEANRLATRYFSSHTLDGVMGGQRQALQEYLRAELARAVDRDRAGVDIVAFLIDAIHPPAGAAGAYHAVQAAQINADASAYQATAHAVRTAGQAQQEAHQATASAEGSAVEKINAASGDAYQFAADRNAYRASSAAFLLERRARSLLALKGARLMILDHHLTPQQAPLIDLRGMGGAVAAAAGSPPPLHEMSEGFTPEQQTPAISTEGAAPASTSEQAAEDAQHAAARVRYQ